MEDDLETEEEIFARQGALSQQAQAKKAAQKVV
jgi:hypothetical protein